MFEKRKHDNFGDKNIPFLFNTSGYAVWREKVMKYVHKYYTDKDIAELRTLLDGGAADITKISRIIELLTAIAQVKTKN